MIRIVWHAIAEASTRQVRIAEALARNVHDVEIPDLDDSAIALQCLAQAVKEAQSLKASGLFASINIEPSMVNELEELVADPRGIFFEVTERGRILAPDKFKALRDHGFSFGVDDWPQEFSGEHLKVLVKPGLVKISQQFFRSSSAAELSQAIATMHSLGMKVVAEGVETDEDWDTARGAGADYVQGFHPDLGLPMPLPEFQERFCPRT
jgi:EAL domain-containing protein (putative c-di-GMP-specific phosphodiesterase class I)